MENTHKKHAKKPRSKLRQQDYQVSNEDWIKNLLSHGSHGTIATTYETQPFITPVIYLYIEEDHALYFHGARTGRLRANIHFNPKVAFNFAEFGNILSHQDASEFNVAYKSVTVFGSAYLVVDEDIALSILNKLLKKYAPQLESGKDFISIQPDELLKTAVYKIEIEEWSGKQQIETSDYLDSFEYTQYTPHSTKKK